MNNRINLSNCRFLLCILFCGSTLAQTPSPSPTPAPPPANDIFLVDVTTRHGEIKLGAPEKITDWDGYNNQPFFFPDGQSLFYTSIRADKQADIYRYEIQRWQDFESHGNARE